MQIKLGIIKLGRKHAAIVKDRGVGIRVLTGGYGSAKTFTGGICAIDLGLRYGHQGPILVTEPTYSMITDVVVPTIYKICESIGLPCQYKIAKHIFIIGKHKKFELWCRGLDKPRSCEGINAIGYWGDEWELCKPDSFLPAMARVRVGDSREIILTGTPEGFNANYKMILDPVKRKQTTREYILSTRDNPFLPPDYYENTKALLPSTEAVLEKLEGIRTAKGGRVFSRFSRENNKITEQTLQTKRFKRTRYAICCDFNVDYMHWLICEIDDELKSAKVIEEIIYEGGTTTDDHAKRTIDRLCKVTGRSVQDIRDMRIKAYCDAYGSARNSVTVKSNFTLLQQAGFVVQAPSKNPPIDERVNTLQVLFRDNRVWIAPNVTTLTTNLETMAYDQKTGDPDKKNNIDHGCFVGETMIETINGPKRIDQIIQGEFVLTRQGYKKVICSTKTQENAEIVKVKTDIGEILCTPDHPFFNGSEFLRIDAFSYCDNVYTWQNQNQSHLTESFTDDIRTQKTTQIASITDQMDRQSQLDIKACIVKFGSTISAKYQKAMKYITLMETQKITQLKTLNASHRKSMQISTEKNTQKKRCLNYALEWIMRELLQLSGTKQKKQKIQQSREVMLLGAKQPCENLHVKNAENYFRKDAFNRVSFVQTIVRKKTEENQGLTTKLDAAENVEKNSRSINTLPIKPVRLLAVEKCQQKRDVYNLEIEQCHEFFANGILVHNCEALSYMTQFLWPVHAPKANDKQTINVVTDEWGLL